MNLQLQATRIAMRALERTAPRLGAALAERLFFTPPRTTLTPSVRETLATGRPFRVCVDEGRVSGWAWGSGPVIALVHGWGGRGGRLAAPFVEPLVASGFSVVAFDAPGHGASDGRLSSMPQFARALGAVAAEVGSLYGIVAHSMGGSSSTLAMAGGVRVERAVFIAPAADPARFAQDFAKLLAVGPVALEGMRRRSEARLRFSWSDLYVPRLAARLTAPLLVFHDRDDATVPYDEGAAIAAAWPGAELVTTTGLGHRDIVRDPDVVAQAVAFLRAGEPNAVDAPPCAIDAEAAWLDRDLFEREGRRMRLFGISDT